MTKPSRRLMTVAIVVLVVLSPLMVMALFIEDWSRDLSTNVAWTDPAGEELAPLELAMDVPSVERAISAFAETKANWTQPQPPEPLPDDSPINQISSQPVGETQFHLVRETGLMRYKDDVWVVAEPLAENQVRIHAHSQSRVGKGDLGQNPRNLRELLAALRDADTSAPGSAGGSSNATATPESAPPGEAGG